jgi:hypothetical protein
LSRVRVWLGEVKDPNYLRVTDPDRPQLLIGNSREDPETLIAKLNAGSVPGSGFAETHGIKARMDLLASLPRKICGPATHPNKTAARERMQLIKKHLNGLGYVVDTNKGKNVYTVYVVNLRDTAGARVSPHSWVYVGQTTRTPKERLRQHLSGYKASRHVFKHGVDLNRRLYRDVPQTRFKEDVLKLEARLARDLKRRGYNVLGGH